MKNWIISSNKVKVWGQFYLTPTIVMTTTLKLHGYYSIEIGWGKWFLAIDIIPKKY
jgi:hypothetical protein